MFRRICALQKRHNEYEGSQNKNGLSRTAILSEIDKSLVCLQTDYVDLYIIHRFDYNTPVEETMTALSDNVKRIAVALAWLMQKDICTVPLCGATKPNHPEDAADTIGFTLTQDEIAYLEEPYLPHKVVGALIK